MDALIQSLVQANFAPERIAPQASMAQYTTLRIGGPAEVMVNIHSADEIAVALRAAKQADAPVTIIGNGSNLLVRDGGIRGLVLRISGGLNAIRREGDCLLVQAGASLAAVAAFARDEGLSGMAELGGIPGTVGGGVLMNAGAYGAELAQLVTQAEGVSLSDGRRVVYPADRLDFAYRHSALMDAGVVITQATLALTPGDPEAIRARMEECAKARREKQPLTLPSAGSTFKRPEGHFAAKLIDDCGLRGLTVGGAQVSEKHAGFLLNRGGTAADFLALMAHVQQVVRTQTGVQLEPVASEQSQKLLFGAGLLAQCMVVQPQALTLCEDAYSTKGEFQPQWETQERTMRLDAQVQREPIRASFPAQAAAVLDCRVYPDAQALERTDDGVTVHVPLRADLVYTDSDGAVQAETFRTEVSCHTALNENGLCEAVCMLQPEGYASAGSGAVELRYDAVFQVQTFSRQKLQNLSGGTLDLTRQQNTQRPSVVIRRISENAALWDLARQYRTTAQSIQQANHLTQPEADAGRLLLIPM